MIFMCSQGHEPVTWQAPAKPVDQSPVFSPSGLLRLADPPDTCWFCHRSGATAVATWRNPK